MTDPNMVYDNWNYVNNFCLRIPGGITAMLKRFPDDVLEIRNIFNVGFHTLGEYRTRYADTPQLTRAVDWLLYNEHKWIYLF